MTIPAKLQWITTVLTLATAASGCGEHAAAYSAPVGINLKAKSGDVQNNVVTEAKAITTESGNPYGAFINAAQQRLGHNPGSVTVSALTLQLGAGSSGVTALEQIFTGEVDVFFLMNDTNNTYSVGHVSSPHGSGPIDMAVDFTDTLTGLDRDRLMSGSFKVVLRGPAAAGFANQGADANLQVTFKFEAYP